MYEEKRQHTVNALVASFEDLLAKNPFSAWCAIANIRGSQPPMKLAEPDAKKRLDSVKCWFRDLGGKPSTHPVSFPTIEYAPALCDDPITREEIEQALAQTSGNRATGLDKIAAEMLKLPGLLDTLTDVMNEVYHTGTAPVEWRRTQYAPIPKKGDRSKIENWRGIALMSSGAKLFDRILLNRLRALDPFLRQNQAGFRPLCSTTEQQMAVRHLVDCALLHKGLPIDLMFVDFAKAFPSVSFPAIRATLHAWKAPERLIAAVMAVYDRHEACVKTPDGLTDFFAVDVGVLQGDTLAPYLFVLVLDMVLRKVFAGNSEAGLVLRPRQGTRTRTTAHAIHATDLEFADDIVFFDSSTAGLQATLLHLETEAALVGLTANFGANKTEIMQYGDAHPHTPVVSLHGKKVELAKKYKYLGYPLDHSKAVSATAVEGRIGKAWSAIVALGEVWKSGASTTTKLRLFKAMAESALTFGCASWVLPKRLADRLRTTYSRMLRYVTGVSWRDQAEVEHLFDYGRLPQLHSTVLYRQLKTFGHVMRQGHESAKILAWQPTQDIHAGKHQGGQRLTLARQIATAVNLPYEEALQATLDRVLWRKLCYEAGNKVETAYYATLTAQRRKRRFTPGRLAAVALLLLTEAAYHLDRCVKEDWFVVDLRKHSPNFGADPTIIAKRRPTMRSTVVQNGETGGPRQAKGRRHVRYEESDRLGMGWAFDGR